MRLTFPNWGLGHQSGLPKLQSSIVGVKTPRLRVFFISLESYWSVDVENGLALAIQKSAAQVMAKKRPRIKLAVWLPSIKSQKSTQPQCVQVKCDTPLENSRRELQICFKPHLNCRFEQRVISSQSGGSPNRDKKPFGCRCRRETQRILYGGRWWLPPSSGHGESCEFRVARGLS
jgi:hypothetical protein